MYVHNFTHSHTYICTHTVTQTCVCVCWFSLLKCGQIWYITHTHSDTHARGQGDTVCVGSVNVFMWLLSVCKFRFTLDTNGLYSEETSGLVTDTRKHKAFNLARHPLPVSVFGVPAGLFWFWFCMFNDFWLRANTLAFTMMGDNHVTALLALRYPAMMRSLCHDCERRKMWLTVLSGLRWHLQI